VLNAFLILSEMALARPPLRCRALEGVVVKVAVGVRTEVAVGAGTVAVGVLFVVEEGRGALVAEEGREGTCGLLWLVVVIIVIVVQGR